jgi:hypothetical protein
LANGSAFIGRESLQFCMGRVRDTNRCCRHVETFQPTATRMHTTVSHNCS